MPYQILRMLSSMLLVVFVAAMVSAQTRPRPRPRPTPTPEITDEKPGEPKDIETLKTDTNLVTVPVIATDRSGLYIANLTKDDFTIREDGVQQEIAFFAQTSAPFHVVLMLDTSASTQDKLAVIQQAAFAFVQQLQANDRVKVVSFDDEVRDLNDFTNDRAMLKAAINKTRSGSGTKLYDAVALSLNSLRQIQGRKAIVVFTDGVDWHSSDATFDGTIRWLDEEGVIVYPIRYDTRAATERIAREQSESSSPVLPTSDVLFPGSSGRTAPGTTPPTFPSDDPIPTTGSSSKNGPLGFPSAQEILRRRREQERDRDTGRSPSQDGLPGTNNPAASHRESLADKHSRHRMLGPLHALLALLIR